MNAFGKERSLIGRFLQVLMSTVKTQRFRVLGAAELRQQRRLASTFGRAAPVLAPFETSARLLIEALRHVQDVGITHHRSDFLFTKNRR